MISPSVYSLDIDNNKELKAKSISNFEGKSNNIKLSSFQNIGSNLNFYTNYNGNEKTTKLNLFRATKVDVNDDGKDDFRIRLTFYPSITRPIALALNFKLTIRGLSGYDSLDKNALFEAFVDFYRLGLFERFSKGNHIEYGYQSSEGQEIPKSCKITYQLVPHLLSLKKKPEHKVEINTNLEDTDLAVLFSYSNIKEDVEVAEHKFVALYQPVGNPKISFGRTGDSSIEFKREDTGSSYVTLRYTKTQGDNVTNFYVKDVPNHITFTSKLGKDGKIEFDTHGESVEEIGICDDFEDPTFKVYFTNLASKAGFEWSYDRFILLKRGKAELTAYSDGEDIGFNTYLKGTANGFIHFEACSHNPLGFSFYLDFDEKYIRINRSEVELTISLYGKILNETIQAYLTTINCSFELKRTFEGPFEVQFDDLGSGAVSFDLAGKNLQISNLDIDVNSPMIGGEFSLECEELVKTNEGNISAAVSIEKENNNISGSCRLEVKHGVQITNLLLKYNEATLYQGDLNVEGSITRWFNFTVNLTVEWHVTDDGGYVLIKGGSYAAFDFNSLYFDEHDDLVGAVSGNIRFKILDEVFNISWTKIDGNYSFSFDGSAVAELSDFHFWLKDKVDISVSHISGSFILDTDGPTNSGYLLINMESNPAILDVNIQDFKNNLRNIKNYSFKIHSKFKI